MVEMIRRTPLPKNILSIKATSAALFARLDREAIDKT